VTECEEAFARLLEGLTFDLGEGSVTHPLFARWAEEQVDRALRGLQP
jgi:hypothetical protein